MELTEKVLVEALQTEHILAPFKALLCEQLRPRLHDSDHAPGFALNLGFGVLEQLVVQGDRMLQRLFLVDIRACHEHVPATLSVGIGLP